MELTRSTRWRGWENGEYPAARAPWRGRAIRGVEGPASWAGSIREMRPAAGGYQPIY